MEKTREAMKTKREPELLGSFERVIVRVRQSRLLKPIENNELNTLAYVNDFITSGRLYCVYIISPPPTHTHTLP